MPEILNLIQIQWLGGQDQRPDVVLTIPVGNAFARLYVSLSSLKQNWCWNNSYACWWAMTPHTSAICQYTWSHWQFRRRCLTLLWAMHAAPEDASAPSGSGTRVRFFLTKNLPHKPTCMYNVWTWLPNKQEVLSSLYITFFHILQLQMVYRWIRLLLSWWAIGHSHLPLPACLVGPQTELQTPATHCCQQPCTSPITCAGVPAISTCGWSKICSDACDLGEVHVMIPTDVEMKVFCLKLLAFKDTINKTHVALHIINRIRF